MKDSKYQNNYIPESELIIKLKKYSISKCFTFTKQDSYKPWSDFEISTDIEIYPNMKIIEIISNNFNIFDEDLLAIKIPQQETSKNSQILALPSPNNVYAPADAAGMAHGSDDFFGI